MYNRPFSIQYGRKVFRFNPCGATRIIGVHGKRRNPKTEVGLGKVWGVRMFVGFSVKQKPKYSITALVAETRDCLRKMGFPEDASFVAQRGVYTYAEGGKVVEEDSAQVIILDTTLFDKDKFLQAMQLLAEYLVVALEQESIFVQVQYANVVRDTWRVTP